MSANNNSNHAYIKRNKILVMIPAAKIGGAEKMMMVILESLRSAGNIIVLAVGSSEGGNKAIIDASEYVLGNDRARGSIRQCIRILVMEQPDIVFLNLGYLNLAGFVRIASPRIKIVARLGNTVTAELPSNRFLRNIKILILKIVCMACTKVIVQSELMKTDLLSVIRLDKGKVIVVPNVVENDFRYKMSQPNSLNVEKYIFCAATFKRQKRIDLLVTAAAMVMSQVENIELVVAGTSRQEVESAGLLENIDSQILKRIHFIGFIDNILPLIRDSLFCVSSSDYEGSSNYLIEANAMNKLCLVTDCPGANRETFHESKNAIFISPGNAALLAQGMLSAIDRVALAPLCSLDLLSETSNILDEQKSLWQGRLLEAFA